MSFSGTQADGGDGRNTRNYSDFLSITSKRYQREIVYEFDMRGFRNSSPTGQLKSTVKCAIDSAAEGHSFSYTEDDGVRFEFELREEQASSLLQKLKAIPELNIDAAASLPEVFSSPQLPVSNSSGLYSFSSGSSFSSPPSSSSGSLASQLEDSSMLIGTEASKVLPSGFSADSNQGTPDNEYIASVISTRRLEIEIIREKLEELEELWANHIQENDSNKNEMFIRHYLAKEVPDKREQKEQSELRIAEFIDEGILEEIERRIKELKGLGLSCSPSNLSSASSSLSVSAEARIQPSLDKMPGGKRSLPKAPSSFIDKSKSLQGITEEEIFSLEIEEFKSKIGNVLENINQLYSVGISGIEMTILHILVQYESEIKSVKEKVDFLIKQGANVNQLDSFRRSSLSLAIDRRNIGIASRMLDKKISPNINLHVLHGGNVATTPLILAVRKNLLDIVKRMKKDFKMQFEQMHKDGHGLTAIEHAAMDGYIEIIRLFPLKNIVTPTKYSNSLLHLAASSGSVESVRYLVEEKKLDPAQRSRSGKTSLHFAIGFQKPEKRLSVVKFLLGQKSVYFNERDFQGDTPLHYAIREKDIALIEIFLAEMENYPDLWENMSNYFGRTPLYYASAFSIDEKIISKIPLTLKAHVGDSGISEIHEAAASGNIAALIYLIEQRNCNFYAIDERGYTLLMASIIGGNLDLIKYVLKLPNCQLEHQDKEGRTAIFHAAETQNLKIFNEIKAAGVNMTHRNKEGRNVLFYMIKCFPLEMADVRKAFSDIVLSFDINERDEEGYTIVLEAIKKGINTFHSFIEIIKLNVISSTIVNLFPVTRGGVTPYDFCFQIEETIDGEPINKKLFSVAKEICSKDIPNEIFDICSLEIPFFKKFLMAASLYDEEINLMFSLFNFLIENGLDINYNFNGNFLLSTAVEKKNKRLVYYLIAKGANPYLLDHVGYSVLSSDFFLKIAGRDFFPSEILMKLFQYAFPLHRAVKDYSNNECQYREAIKYLVTKGIDINLVDDYGKRAICYAEKTPNLCAFLEKNGAKNSIFLDSEKLQSAAIKQGSPVIWLENLDLSYYTKLSVKSLVISSDVHRDLSFIGNTFRRKFEYDSIDRKIKRAKKSPEIQKIKKQIREYNETPHNRIYGEGVPNFVVAAISFVFSIRRKSNHNDKQLKISDKFLVRAKKEIICLTDFTKVDRKAKSDFLKISKQTREHYQKTFSGSRFILDDSFDEENPDQDLNIQFCHSEQAFYIYLEQNIENIMEEHFEECFKQMYDGDYEVYKVNALIIDMHSTREMCGNCVDRTISIQTSVEDNSFKMKITNFLKNKLSLALPKNGIYITTRVSYSDFSDGAHVPSPTDSETTAIAFVGEKAPSIPEYPHKRVYFKPNIKETNSNFIFSHVDSSKPKALDSYAGILRNFTIFQSREKIAAETETAYKELFYPSPP